MAAQTRNNVTPAQQSSYTPDAEEIEEAEMIRRTVQDSVPLSQQLRDTVEDVKNVGQEAKYYARNPQQYLKHYGRIQDQFARASSYGTFFFDYFFEKTNNLLRMGFYGRWCSDLHCACLLFQQTLR